MNWLICLFIGHKRNPDKRRWYDKYLCDRCENWIEAYGAHQL
jgi:hypothetical protein